MFIPMSILSLSRRNFLKLAATSLGSAATLAFNPFPHPQDTQDYPYESIGRVAASNQVVVYREPREGAPLASQLSKNLHLKDTLFPIYYEIESPEGPRWNPTWYRVWGGFVHSGYVQKVKFRFNQPLPNIRSGGQLCEVTVPYSQTYKYSAYQGWESLYRLYYETTHWVAGVEEGPDKGIWYRILSPGRGEYIAPAEHFRPIPDKELEPISPEVPWEEKRIEVSIGWQRMEAYEGEQVVFEAIISTGLNIRPVPDELPWSTPRGRFNIRSKMPSQHMGEGNLTGDTEAYELPGVPWTLFFTEEGHAFHGAYWHDNFGAQMSHGCINMRPKEAQWLFRWAYPVFEIDPDERRWTQNGYGTTVIIR